MPRRSLTRFRRWHSINLIPHFNSVSIIQNDAPYLPVGRMFEFVWLGWIFDLTIPTKHSWKAWGSGTAVGPRWSRRQKKWKWGKEL